MKLLTLVKSIAVIPLIIAGGFTILFFSYMLIPMLVASSIGTIIYLYINETKDNQKNEESNGCETGSQRRQRYMSESRIFNR